jgi:hypothetical protein
VTVVQTLLVYVGIPLAIILVLALLTLVPGRRKRPRYRPGQPWEHAAIWYAPHAESSEADGHGDGHGDGHAALGAGGATALTAGSSSATPPAVGGPRGGARGAW